MCFSTISIICLYVNRPPGHSPNSQHFESAHVLEKARGDIGFTVPTVLCPELLQVLLDQELRFLLRDKTMRPRGCYGLPPNARFDFVLIHVASHVENLGYVPCSQSKAKPENLAKWRLPASPRNSEEKRQQRKSYSVGCEALAPLVKLREPPGM